MFGWPTNAQLSGSAPDREFIHPSIVFTSHPPSVREGTGHTVPRSCSALKGSWERLRKHLRQFCQLGLLLTEAGELGSAGPDTGGVGRREAEVTRYHKTNKNDQVVHFKCVPLTVLRLYLNKVREKRKREMASLLPPQKWPTPLGKQVLMRKFN